MNCPHCGSEVSVVVVLTTVPAAAPTQICSTTKQIESEIKQNGVNCVSKGGSGGSVSDSVSSSDPDSGSLEARSTEVVSKSGYSLDFQQFWALYPKKKNKGDAWKAWKSERPVLANLLNALSWQCNSAEWLKQGGQFVPYPGTYLRARGWEDEKPSLTVVRSDKPLRDLCDFHLDGHYNRFSNRPSQNCPPCRELKAKYAVRHVTEDELFAKG